MFVRSLLLAGLWPLLLDSNGAETFLEEGEVVSSVNLAWDADEDGGCIEGVDTWRCVNSAVS